MKAPEAFVIIDVETNGLPKIDSRGNLDFSGVRVLEIGALYAVEFGYVVANSFSTLIAWRDDNGDLIPTPPEITKLNGINDELIEHDGELPERAASRFDDWIFPILGKVKPSSIPILGHNLIQFDWHCLAKFGGLSSFISDDRDVIRIDTRLAWQAYQYGLRRGIGERLETFWGRCSLERESHPALSSLSFLRGLFRGVGAEKDQTHRAFDDCLLTLDLYRELDSRGIFSSIGIFE